MKAQTIFIVAGASGEYEEREEWLVKAFVDRKASERFRDEVSAAARAISEKHGERDREAYDKANRCEHELGGVPCGSCDFVPMKKRRNPLDPKREAMNAVEWSYAQYFCYAPIELCSQAQRVRERPR